MRRVLIALQFLTRLPVPLYPAPDGAEIGHAMVHFPTAGLALGLTLAGLDRILGLMLPAPLTDILLVGALAAFSGAMHLDGLADTADGFYAGGALPPGPERKERVLSVMKDSRIGVMGALAVFFLLLVKIYSLHLMPPGVKTSALIMAPLLSRWFLVWAASFCDYARPAASRQEGAAPGLGHTFTLYVTGRELFRSSILPVLAAFFLWGVSGLVCVVFLIFIAGGLIHYIKSAIEGMTGDTFGALNEIMECCALLAALYACPLTAFNP